jgi:hypothetical protein
LGSLPIRRPRHEQVHADAELLVEERGQLADGHAVPRRDGIHPDERLERRIEQGALHDLAADRIGTIQNDEGDVLLRSRLHRERHRGDVGPRASAHFRQVVDENVDGVEHGRARTAILRLIEREDRDAGFRIAVVDDPLARGGGAADPVLGREQRHQLQILVRGDEVDLGRSSAVDACMVRDQTDALPAHLLRDVRKEHFDARPDAVAGARYGLRDGEGAEHYQN